LEEGKGRRKDSSIEVILKPPNETSLVEARANTSSEDQVDDNGKLVSSVYDYSFNESSC